MTKLGSKLGFNSFIIWIIGITIAFFNVKLLILLDYQVMYWVCPILLIITIICWAVALGLLVAAAILEGRESE